MSVTRYPVVVAGLGAMGSAVALHLARRGVRVLGLDGLAPPHARGSSHGETRIFRQAYFEDPSYVPMVQRALHLWDELEGESGRRLLLRTGALMVGDPQGRLVRGALRSAEQHHLPASRLDAAEVTRRYGVLRPDAGSQGVYESEAGILFPEACVAASLERARAHGAEVRLNEPLVGWRPLPSGVEVATPRGRWEAEQLVLAVGPWLPGLLPSLPLEVERQVMHWFPVPPGSHELDAGRLPVFLWETAPDVLFYGVPSVGGGVKVARHHGGERGALSELDDTVREADVEEVRGFLRRHLPSVDGTPVRSAVCRYTNTPTGHFLLDRHPDHPQVHLVSPCSGHGFKFASVIGELMADRITGSPDSLDLSRFTLAAVSSPLRP